MTERQNELQALVDQVSANGAAVGFVLSVFDDTSTIATIDWYGSLPVALPSIQDQAIAEGLTLRISSVPFSKPSLQSAENLLLSTGSSLGATYVALPESGNSLEVHFSTAPEAVLANMLISGSSNNVHSSTESAFRNAVLANPFGIPVTISSLPVSPAQFDGRRNDSEPWYSGDPVSSYLNDDNGCTLGLPMHRGSFTDGSHEYWLLAGHCVGFDDNEVIRLVYQANNYIGYSSSTENLDSHYLDAGLVNGLDHSVGTYIWDGAYNQNTGFSKLVVGGAGNSYNESLCQSGGYSGTICGLTVVESGTVNTNGDLFEVYETAVPNHTTGGGEGDSGAAVFSLSGSTAVIGHGLLQGGDHNAPATCVGVATNCSYVIYITDLNAIENVVGITTGSPQ